MTNLGTVLSTGAYGVFLIEGGRVTNGGSFTAQRALISGYGDGIRIAGTTGTVTIFGAADAVLFNGNGDVLIAEPGAVFDGAVNGGGTSTVTFAQAGVVGFSNFLGFSTVDLGSGAANTLTMSNANFTGVTGAAIVINGGNSGNTVDASALTGGNRVAFGGGGGPDVLTGGSGNDFFSLSAATLAAATVNGGGGADAFEFVTPGSLATPDSNTVTDFAHGTDKIAFSDIGFALGLAGATSTPQALPSTLFSTRTDGSFDNTTERFAYNATTGQLLYSDDGSGSDPSLATATLTGHRP